MKINQNILANYGSRLWTGVSAFIFVPLYLRILGPEAFGLVTFSTSLLGIVFVLDMGMSNTFAREMARQTDRARLADLLRSLEWLYLAIILIVIIVAVAGGGLIADYWLNASRLQPGEVRWSVSLMMISSVLQVMLALYIGGMLGSNRHVAAASYQIGFSVVRSGVVLIPLFFIRSVEFLFVWQLLASLGALLLARRTVWKWIAPAERPSFSTPALRMVKGFAGGMLGISLISAINTQSDKLVVSKAFTLDVLGFYSIASLVGQIPSMLALPLAITILPRMTADVTRGNGAGLHNTYMRYSFLISLVAFCTAAGIIAATHPLLFVLKGSEPTVELVIVTRLLALGGVLLALQYMPYHLAIANGHTRTNLAFGLVSAVVLPVVMFVGASRFGLLGAAVPWVCMNALAVIYLAIRITPRFLGPHLGEWIRKAIGAPLLPGGLMVLGGGVLSNLTVSPLFKLLMVGVFGVLVLLASTYLAYRAATAQAATSTDEVGKGLA